MITQWTLKFEELCINSNLNNFKAWIEFPESLIFESHLMMISKKKNCSAKYIFFWFKIWRCCIHFHNEYHYIENTYFSRNFFVEDIINIVNTRGAMEKIILFFKHFICTIRLDFSNLLEILFLVQQTFITLVYDLQL